MHKLARQILLFRLCVNKPVTIYGCDFLKSRVSGFKFRSDHQLVLFSVVLNFKSSLVTLVNPVSHWNASHQRRFLTILCSLSIFVSLHVSVGPKKFHYRDWRPFLARESPGNFSGPKSNFSSSVSKNGEVYAPEISSVKGIFVHINNMRMNQLCNFSYWGFEILLSLYGPEYCFQVFRLMGPWWSIRILIYYFVII